METWIEISCFAPVKKERKNPSKRLIVITDGEREKRRKVRKKERKKKEIKKEREKGKKKQRKKERKKGRIHGNPVADGWAGAVMRKPLRIQKCDGRTDRPTDRPTDRHGKV